MTWTSFHHRGETLRAVIATANVRRDGLLPLDVAGVRETFEDELALLAALQLKWHTRLAGRIERELVAQPLDLAAAVERAWQEVADELPGVRAILDHYRAEPVDEAMAEAMAKATVKEHLLLATMAGRCSVGDLERGPHRGAAGGAGPARAPGGDDAGRARATAAHAAPAAEGRRRRLSGTTSPPRVGSGPVPDPTRAR